MKRISRACVFMNLTALLAVIIAWGVIVVLKQVVKHALLRKAGRVELAELRQQSGTTK